MSDDYTTYEADVYRTGSQAITVILQEGPWKDQLIGLPIHDVYAPTHPRSGDKVKVQLNSAGIARWAR